MTRVTVDDELRRKLYDFGREIELCDEQGKVLARVKPVIDLAELGIELPSKEELDRRSATEKRYTTKEVLDYLERL